MKAETYFIATQGIALDALAKTIEQFLMAKVDDHDRKRVPTVPQLVHQAAKWQDVLHPQPKVAALPAPEPAISAAEKMRVAAGLIELGEELERRTSAAYDDYMAPIRAKLRERNDRALAADPRSLAERLNLDRFQPAE